MSYQAIQGPSLEYRMDEQAGSDALASGTGPLGRGTERYLSKMGFGSLDEYRSSLDDGSLEHIVKDRKKDRKGLRKVAGVANDIAFKAYGMAMRQDDRVSQAMGYISSAVSEEGKIDGSHAYELMEAAGVNNQATEKVVKELTTNLYEVEGEIKRPYAITDGKIGKAVNFANKYLGLGLIGDGLQIYHKEGEGKLDTLLRNGKVSGEVSTAVLATAGVATASAGIALYSGAGAVGQQLQEAGHDSGSVTMEHGSTMVDGALTGLFVLGAIQTGNALYAGRAANSLIGTSSKVWGRYTKDEGRKKNLYRAAKLTGLAGTFGLLGGIAGCTGPGGIEDADKPQSTGGGKDYCEVTENTVLKGGEFTASTEPRESDIIDLTKPPEVKGETPVEDPKDGGKTPLDEYQKNPVDETKKGEGEPAKKDVGPKPTQGEKPGVGEESGENADSKQAHVDTKAPEQEVEKSPIEYVNDAQEKNEMFIAKSDLWQQIRPDTQPAECTSSALEQIVQLEDYDNQSLVLDGKHNIAYAQIGDKVDEVADHLEEGEKLYAVLSVDGEMERKEITAQNLKEGCIGFEADNLEGFNEGSDWYFGFGVEEEECGNFTYIASVADELVGEKGYSILEAFDKEEKPAEQPPIKPPQDLNIDEGDKPEVPPIDKGPLYHTAELLPGLPLFFGSESDIGTIELSSYDGDGKLIETEHINPTAHEGRFNLAGILTDYTHNPEKVQTGDCTLAVRYGGHIDVAAFGQGGKELDIGHDNFFGRHQDTIGIPGSLEGYFKETRNSNPLNLTHEQISHLHENVSYGEGLKESIGHPLKSTGHNFQNIIKDATIGADQIAADGTEVQNGRVGILEGGFNMLTRPLAFLGYTATGDPGEGLRQLGSIFTDTRDIVLGANHVVENTLFTVGDAAQSVTSMVTSPIHPEGAHHFHAALFDDVYQTGLDSVTDITFGEAWFRAHSIDLEKGINENPGMLVPFLNYTLQERGIDSSLVAGEDVCVRDVTMEQLVDPYRFGHDDAVIDHVGTTGARKAIEIIGSIGFDLLLYDLLQDEGDDGGEKRQREENPPEELDGQPTRPGDGGSGGCGNISNIHDANTPGDIPSEYMPGNDAASGGTSAGAGSSAGASPGIGSGSPNPGSVSSSAGATPSAPSVTPGSPSPSSPVGMGGMANKP